MTTALLTDHYELTMVDAALHDGTAHRSCVFETFARRLPPGRRFGVVAGLDRLIEAILDFRFHDEQLDYLDDHALVSPKTLEFLADYRFSGELHAFREGEVYFPGTPVLTVCAPFAEAVVLETLVLSVLNYDSAVASAASRMAIAAQGRPLLEFGSRRAQERAAVAAARATYVAGFAATSNLQAGLQYGIPTRGTSAHAFTLVHDDELSAFRSQVESQGQDTTLLVDTYDIEEGVRRAVDAGGPELGAVRIDSGDLESEAKQARDLLDDLGAGGTRIVLSGDLDEYSIQGLQAAPADAYGVGTSVVTGSGAPTAGFVYKLVARSTTPGGPREPVAKGGGVKATIGEQKSVARHVPNGVAAADHVGAWNRRPGPDERALQVLVMRDGEVHHRPGLDDIRAHHQDALAELPAAALEMADGEPAIPTVYFDQE